MDNDRTMLFFQTNWWQAEAVTEDHMLLVLGLQNHLDRAAKDSLGSTPLSIRNRSIVQVSNNIILISFYLIGSAMG